MNNTHDILFSTAGDTPYPEALETTRQKVLDALGSSESRHTEAEIKNIINSVIINAGIKCSLTKDVEELTNYIYHDMAGYSFITREKLFDIDGFEELNINAWNDVDIKTKGEKQKTKYSFLSKQQAIDIHRRMLEVNQTLLDDAMPRAIADLGSNIRICIEMSPVVDEDVGIISVIRKVQSTAITVDKLVSGGTATQEMLDLILLCLNNGASACVSGGTGSGKTTSAGAILTEVSRTKRTVTIEEGSREWNFVRKDENGKRLNSVIHLKTRASDDSKFNINQNVLVKDALRLTPEFLGIGEVRGEEAYEVVSAANTGHTTLTTIHANYAKAVPKRFITLMKKAYPMDDGTLYDMVVEAFPILIHKKKFIDGVRRIKEIVEVIGLDENEKPVFSTIYKFAVKKNIFEDEKGKKLVVPIVDGSFIRVNPISKNLRELLIENGARNNEVDFYAEKA